MYTRACSSFLPRLLKPLSPRAVVQELCSPSTRASVLMASGHPTTNSSASPLSLRWSEHKTSANLAVEPKNQTTALTSPCANVWPQRRTARLRDCQSAGMEKSSAKLFCPGAQNCLISASVLPLATVSCLQGLETFTLAGNIQIKQDAPALGNATGTRDMSCDTFTSAAPPPHMALGLGSTARAELGVGFCSFQGQSLDRLQG